MAKNILFIMCDQLRADYLSCYGHPHLHTPHIDALAARGLRFTQAYVQSTICGPSRMCTYTGRYMRTHGSTQNGVPLKVGELTLGDHLGKLGMRSVLVGKTHMVADQEGMQRLGIAPDSVIGVRVSECGFDPYERDDGLHPDGPYSPTRPTTPICATTALMPKIRGNIGPTRGRLPMARCKTVGFGRMPTKPPGCPTNIPKPPI